jgi:hypothetical protein
MEHEGDSDDVCALLQDFQDLEEYTSDSPDSTSNVDYVDPTQHVHPARQVFVNNVTPAIPDTNKTRGVKRSITDTDQRRSSNYQRNVSDTNRPSSRQSINRPSTRQRNDRSAERPERPERPERFERQQNNRPVERQCADRPDERQRNNHSSVRRCGNNPQRDNSQRNNSQRGSRGGRGGRGGSCHQQHSYQKFGEHLEQLLILSANLKLDQSMCGPQLDYLVSRWGQQQVARSTRILSGFLYDLAELAVPSRPRFNQLYEYPNGLADSGYPNEYHAPLDERVNSRHAMDDNAPRKESMDFELSIDFPPQLSVGNGWTNTVSS